MNILVIMSGLVVWLLDIFDVEIVRILYEFVTYEEFHSLEI